MKHSDKIPSYKITDIKKKKSFAADFEFYRFEYFVTDIDHLTHPHRHDHFALFFVTAGQGEHLIDFEEYELRAGRVFLIAPGQIHAWRRFRGVKGFVLLFTKEFFTLTLQYKELRAYLFFNNIYKHAYLDVDRQTGQHLRDLLMSIEQESQHHRTYSQNIIRSYINIILFELTGIYERSLPSSVGYHTVDVKIREFEGLIEKNFKKYHLVADYAVILHITPNYLNAICTRRKGKPAGEVIRDRIILEAKRLLTHSDRTITQIAYELGFEDNSYFGRFFRKYCGQTPAGFREAHV
jgi:AraC-like DNA-binding protein/mannose-6-phosphate isomerase-like protein (cupin superfamily)